MLMFDIGIIVIIGFQIKYQRWFQMMALIVPVAGLQILWQADTV